MQGIYSKTDSDGTTTEEDEDDIAFLDPENVSLDSKVAMLLYMSCSSVIVANEIISGWAI